MQKTFYTTVLKAFLKAFNKKITQKTTGYSIDAAARKLLEKFKPVGFEFSHSLGHGLGINVHEAPPSLSPSVLAKIVIKPNMCFTIEPGLYKKSFGGVRLENSCYLKQEGEKLTIQSFSNMCFEAKLIDFSLLSAGEKKWLKFFEVK
jgi:Xaa-Pro aminopeptidase